jgi:hypothetical protein
MALLKSVKNVLPAFHDLFTRVFRNAARKILFALIQCFLQPRGNHMFLGAVTPERSPATDTLIHHLSLGVSP